ncbi:transcription initiation factor TFIID subunit A-domain-containing protein [Trichophaea hybrida]|nr:transcription initiation factor TFIID subunit A-domain-containing protein [Trichophaea hybrida]
MSTNGTTDRKRKPTDQNLESSPAPKHIKIDENTMASVQQPRPGISVAQHQILQAVLAQPQMSEDQKRKYVSGIELLRQSVEQKGLNSPEGQAAQMKIDKIFNHLRQLVQRNQQQTLQNQQIASGAVPSGAITGMSAGVSAPAVAAAAGTSSTISAQSAAAQRWIPPTNVPPHQADQWRTEISSKLNNLGHKLSAAKSQVQEHTSALERGGHTPEQEAEIRKKLAEAHAGFTQCKDILSGFYQQQKKLQAAKAFEQQQRQQQAPQQGGPGLGGVQAPPTGGPQQQQRPMPPQQHPHPTQPGMMPAGVHQPHQQPNIPGRPPQAPTQVQQPMQQPAQQQIPNQQPTPIQRVATPVDPARAGSPPNVNSHVTAMNQARQQQQQQTIPASMSPNQPNIPLQNQQQQQQVPPPQVPQQQQPPPPQQQIGRSPAAANVGTPMTAGPNSPAPRPGSTQPQPPGRPQSAAGTTPIQGQQPLGQQTPQQQPRQQQPQTSAPHIQRENPHQQSKMPIPTQLSVPQPTPVSIPAARPSLSGGANTPGNQILGTPAIIKQPAFEFDEGGMGLLSKRKLEELVKQIDPDEKLDPDVEESILELVDEFIDTIATTACKMARLRGSDTLDIKDIQIILERNWNIRIPGYSADEIRTVRKFNPAQGYHHKMNALIAQKQLAQSAGKNGE